MAEVKWPRMGPWHVEAAGGRDVGVYAPGHGFVGIAHLGGPNPDWDKRTRAALVLQATAPDLYATSEALLAKLEQVEEALKSLYILAHVHGMEYSGPTYTEERDAARAALAKARGETNG